MSDCEEENFCYYGKPLQPYDEDAFPKKKPISVEEQIATDAQGRRRFHGAFTGGFSAGFYNTVGSLEGWSPSDFKSTRHVKAQNRIQKPEDFMDDEDIGEFGIAPQTVRATSDYSTSKKRKKQIFSDGPIPGEPVLHSLLTSGNETIGYMLLKNIGLKSKNETSNEKIYGCQMPSSKTYEISRDEIAQYQIHEIYKGFFKKPKDNTFGIGYEGLDKSHINLFQSTKLVIREKNNKKVSIAGQAFGVGAFEEDDEDIYIKDDMSKYDFELTSEKLPKKFVTNANTIFDDFIAGKSILPPKESYPPPTIPQSFTGKYKQKKSRFEPIINETIERKEMTPEIRTNLLDGSKILTRKETVVEVEKEEKPKEVFSIAEFSSLVFDRFVTSSKTEDVSNILENVEPSETLHGAEEMRNAVKMKMFGLLTRITEDWQPCNLLCKRFNVPEPHCDLDTAAKNKKRTKNLIFEYEKFANNIEPGPGLDLKETEEAPRINETIVVESVPEIKVAIPETASDITEKINVDKNLDLFKAVFLSSSESEGDDDDADGAEQVKEKEEMEKQIEIKKSVLSDTMLPKIKPMKDGILSNMDFSIFRQTNKDPNFIQENVENHNLSYGPVLPAQFIRSVDVQINKKVNEESDEWIEKSFEEKLNKKHKKKHKYNKSSHRKKHKHSK